MDRELIAAIYQKYHRELYLYLFSLSKDHAISEELLQDTFVAAMLSLPETRDKLRAWLYKVARNLCFNRMKKESRSVAREDIAPVTAESGDHPAERLLSKERNERLYEAILRLGQSEREVILLQYFAELPQREIASILGITHENVRTIAHRARRQLRKELEANDDEI